MLFCNTYCLPGFAQFKYKNLIVREKLHLNQGFFNLITSWGQGFTETLIDYDYLI